MAADQDVLDGRFLEQPERKARQDFLQLGHADTTVTRTVYAHAFNRPEGSPVADEFAAAIFRTMETASKI